MFLQQNILIDNDDRNTFLFLNAILCSRGYQFITAESGKDGLEK